MAQQDAFSDIPLDQAGALGATSKAAAPPISFFDKVRLGVKAAGAGDDWGWNQSNYEVGGYSKILKGLRDRGYKLPDVGPSSYDQWRAIGTGGPHVRAVSTTEGRAFADAFWKAFNAERARDPKFMSEFGDVHDYATFEQHMRSLRNADAAKVQEQAPDGLGVGGFVGEVVHGFNDPTSYIPVGGGPVAGGVGRRIIGTAVKEAAANAAVTVGLEPLVQQDAAAQGHKRTMGDFAFDVGASAFTGALIGGTVEAGAVGVEKLRGGPEAPAAAPEAAPEPVAPQPAPQAPEVAALDTFKRQVPPEQRTPTEKAAIHAIEREDEVKATSPFVEGPVGDDENIKWLDMGLKAATGEAPLPGSQVKPVAREAIAEKPATANATRNPPRQVLKSKIRRVEEGDGYNERSGATGPYQFVARTWVDLFKRRYPNDKRSFEQIAALRRDPALNEVLMDDLVNENATALRHAGIEETAANLYLAHFLGYDKAITLLRAGGDTPVERLLPAIYLKQNPEVLKGKTAAQVAAWADRKMGGNGDVRFAETATAPEGAMAAETPRQEGGEELMVEAGRYDVEAMLGIAGDDRPILKPEMFGSPEEHAAAQLQFEAARDSAEGFAAVRSADELFSPGAHFDALRQYRGTVTLEAMGEALGMRPDQVRQAVQAMQAIDGQSPFIFSQGGKAKRRVGEDGKVETYFTEPRLMRRPPSVAARKAKAGPSSLLQFLSEHGGINDVGGDLRSMGAANWHQQQGRFVGRLIRDNGMGIDDAFIAAREAGYFPELGETGANRTYDELPDLQLFRDAIDAELRGNKRYLPEDFAAVEAADSEFRWGAERAVDPKDQEAFFDHFDDFGTAEQIVDRARGHGLNLDDDMLIEAYDRVIGGEDLDEAIEGTVMAAIYRDLEAAAGETGDARYATDDTGRPWDDEINFAEPGEEFAAGREAGDGDGRSTPATGAEAADGAAFAQSADAPAERHFDNPVEGPAAKAQADSLEHDLRMDAGLNDLTQGVKSEGEASPEKPVDTAIYRLDDESGDSDLAGILAEIDAAQKAAAEMRGCMAPKKGETE